jgi:hypothetical protein
VQSEVTRWVKLKKKLLYFGCMDLRAVIISLASSAEQIKETIPVSTEVELRLRAADRNWKVFVNSLSKDVQITEAIVSSYDMYKRHGVKNATLRVVDKANYLDSHKNAASALKGFEAEVLPDDAIPDSAEGLPDMSAIIKEKIFSKRVAFLGHLIKVSMSIERIITPFSIDGLLYEGKRTISRKEAHMGSFVVHLSEVTTLYGEGRSIQSKEIEIEILSPEVDCNHVQLVISKALIPRTEYKKIRKQATYKESGITVLDVRRGRWPKPESLTIREILYNFSSSYAITEKTDGERVFLLHSEWGLFQMSSTEQIKMISYERLDDEKMIFDCELCSNGLETTIHVFDVFSPLDLNERMKIVRKFCKHISHFLRQGLRIVAKEHFFFDSYEEMIQRIKQITSNHQRLPQRLSHAPKGNQIEGFVFTPQKLTSRVYKWKVKNTVDFLAKGDKLIIGKGKDSGYKLHLYRSGIEYDGSIIECFISIEDKKATLMRIRKDRSSPNSAETFLRIVESIRQKDKLLKCLNGEGMMLLRALHNDLKKKVLSMFKGRLLDVGSGRGGDIQKWKHFDHVTCIDPDDNAVATFKERLAECDFSRKITMHQCSLSQFAGQHVDAPVLDNMACFFCMNMFSDREVDAFVSLSSKCNNVAMIVMTADAMELSLKRVSIQRISDTNYVIDIPGTFVRNVHERIIDIDGLCERVLSSGKFKLTSFALTPNNISSFLKIDRPLFLSAEEKAFSSSFNLLLFLSNQAL